MAETWGNGHYNCCGCAELGKRSKRCLGCLTATPLGKVYMENWTPKEKPKQTQADVIRSMSDEELAEFIPYALDMCCNPTEECMKYFCDKGECSKTNECVMQWLKSEVKE